MAIGGDRSPERDDAARIRESRRRSGSGAAARRALRPARAEADPVGDLRLRLLDEEDAPQAGAQVRVRLVDSEDRVISERVVTAGPTGYARTHFDVEAGPGTRVRVEPLTERADGARREFEIDGGDGAAAVVRWKRPLDRMTERLKNAGAFTRPPELPDVELAPELFNPSVIEEDGSCSLDFTANVETREYYFHQIIRRDAPGLGPGATRREIVEPLPFDVAESGGVSDAASYAPSLEDAEAREIPDAPPQAHEPSLGKLVTYKHSWTRVGHGVGRLLHSLALAPCEQTRIAMIEWSREERGRRQERTRFDEEMQHALRRDRMIEETVEAVANEMQEGGSSTRQFGAGASGGLAGATGKIVGSLGFGIGGGSASSESWSSGHREISGSTVQELSDRVTQSGSAMRELRSMVVTESEQAESENVRTRMVRNPNRNHAMTVEYFQVLEHHAVRTEVHAQRDVLLVPYEVPAALWEDLPPFTRFRSNLEAARQALSAVPGAVAEEIAPESSGPAPSGPGEGSMATGRFAGGPDPAARIREAVADALEQAEIELKMGESVDTVIEWAIDGAWARIPGRADLDRDRFERVMSRELERRLARVRRGQPEKLLASSGLLAWLDAHSEDLRELVPREHLGGIDALATLVHAPESYETDIPRATASRWTVELREPWRAGLVVSIRTTDGQSVTLRREEDRAKSAVATFSSAPVDVEAIDSVEVTFAPEEAEKTVIRNVAEDMGVLEEVGETVAGVLSALPGDMEKMVQRRVEKAREYALTRLRIKAHTDVSEDLPRSKTYEILDHTARGGGETLTASNHSKPFDGLKTPEVDFLVTTTRRYRDYRKLEALARHVKANRMSYMRAVWLREDPDRRALRLANYTHALEIDGETREPAPLLQLIENRPVAVLGNQVAFPLLEQGLESLETWLPEHEASEERLISLPTRGVFAETLLSKCNAREVRDVRRMYDPDELCPGEAPAISGVTTGSRAGAPDLQPSQLPSPAVRPRAAPQAPAPEGLGAALDAIASGGMFRDMSLGSETVGAAQALARKAMTEAGRARSETLRQLSGKLEEAEREARSAETREAVSAAKDQADVAARSARHDANEAYRAEDPKRIRDHAQAIDDSGAGEDAKRRAKNRLINGDEPEGAGDAETEASETDEGGESSEPAAEPGATATHVRWLQHDAGSFYFERHIHHVELTGFDVDEAELKPEHKRRLDEVVALFKAADGTLDAEPAPEWRDFGDPPYVIGMPDGFDRADPENWKGFREEAPQRLGDPRRLGIPVRDEAHRRSFEESVEPGRFVARYGVSLGATERFGHGFGTIKGGASQTGTEEHNKELSTRRAEAVETYLRDAHGIDGSLIAGTEGLGESAPYVDAVAQGREDLEIARNRYAIFVCTYTYRVALLRDRRDLKRDLRRKLRGIGAGESDPQRVAKREALGAYLMGAHALEMVLDDGQLEPMRGYPDDSVQDVPLAMWTILRDELSDNVTGVWPRSPEFRFSEAEDRRRRLVSDIHGTMSLGASMKRRAWEDVCNTCHGAGRDVSRSLGMDPVPNDRYEELLERSGKLGSGPGVISQLAAWGHFDAVSQFYWLSPGIAGEAETIERDVLNEKTEIPWALP